MLLKIIFSFLSLIFSFTVWACPNCGGSASTFDGNKILILTIFVLLTYVPMSILFRMAIKYKKRETTEKNNC